MNEQEELCGVCKRTVICFTGPPQMGVLIYAFAPGENAAYWPMCLDCGAELAKWLSERREVSRRSH